GLVWYFTIKKNHFEVETHFDLASTSTKIFTL
ncbi:MAG: hypothetical protein ACJART_000756, partial [Maribacter sp.]